MTRRLLAQTALVAALGTITLLAKPQTAAAVPLGDCITGCCPCASPAMDICNEQNQAEVCADNCGPTSFPVGCEYDGCGDGFEDLLQCSRT